MATDAKPAPPLTMDRPEIDPHDFRTALGNFVTGVTVITTRGADGNLAGMTANSFNSVSLDPPLIVWSISMFAPSLAAFRENNYFAVHVLSADQTQLSNQFARPSENKFADLEVEEGLGGIPLLDGVTARFECRNEYNYYGGDHVVMIGRVERYHPWQRKPLVFHRGRYSALVD